MINTLKFMLVSARTMGVSWTARRFWYECRLKSGMIRRRFPQASWEDATAAMRRKSGDIRPNLPANRDPESTREALRKLLAGEPGERLIAEAERVAEGQFPFFSDRWHALGSPTDWFVNPATGGHAAPDRHWSTYAMFDPAYGDLKFVWETSRFGSAFTLARAYALTGDNAHAETFWSLVEDWRAKNPPNTGPQWKCGQETSIRMMAWAFALITMRDAPASTAERQQVLLEMIRIQGERVLATHEYAHLQQNNHAIGEGAGILTAAILTDPDFRTGNLFKAGLDIVEREGLFQIYTDGGYIQKSMNYHRVMLLYNAWLLFLARNFSFTLSGALKERIKRAVEFLWNHIVAESNGKAPSLGSNDGALPIPLDTCDYTDFRPVVQTVCAGLGIEPPFEPGPWDEGRLHLFPNAQTDAQESRLKVAHEFPKIGQYLLTGGKTSVFFRCPTFTDRPGQADALHADIWHAGKNIACDAGSYLYYEPDPWNNGLTHTRAHNTVEVDGADQMKRGPRFFWLNWLKTTVSPQVTLTNGSALIASHDGYTHLPDPVIHTRGIFVANDGSVVIVIDRLTGKGSHRYDLHWLLDAADDFEPLADSEAQAGIVSEARKFRLAVFMPQATDAFKATTIVAAEDDTRGWKSEHYGRKDPALSLSVTDTFTQKVNLVSCFSFEKTTGVRITKKENVIAWTGTTGEQSVQLTPFGTDSIFRD